MLANVSPEDSPVISFHYDNSSTLYYFFFCSFVSENYSKRYEYKYSFKGYYRTKGSYSNILRYILTLLIPGRDENDIIFHYEMFIWKQNMYSCAHSLNN